MRPSEALERHRETIREILSRYPVSNPRVFGSVARGEDTEESDLDIVVQAANELSYFDLFRAQDELHLAIGSPVDLRLDDEFSDRVLRRIQRDFRAL
ncbi:nucleotidyltransferase family protein [Jiella sonneratiae]|uniref:Nucleotidyltransferase family protein n=1 Tax=Jiella sonneratiae TaxID=2816856 RepID=A0ABS3J1A7_9HYPH|nr:nucleotidyltransferase family protein [Jiella sonneratiae]MBO0902336.1 nucleotidyltransferase family protein [Jiella sonneratiae]